jgi:hypothetical protein
MTCLPISGANCNPAAILTPAITAGVLSCERRLDGARVYTLSRQRRRQSPENDSGCDGPSRTSTVHRTCIECTRHPGLHIALDRTCWSGLQRSPARCLGTSVKNNNDGGPSMRRTYNTALIITCFFVWLLTPHFSIKSFGRQGLSLACSPKPWIILHRTLTSCPHRPASSFNSCFLRRWVHCSNILR